jgi:hypothetical protein
MSTGYLIKIQVAQFHPCHFFPSLQHFLVLIVIPDSAFEQNWGLHRLDSLPHAFYDSVLQIMSDMYNIAELDHSLE